MRYILVPVVLLVLGFSAFKVIKIFSEYSTGDEHYQQIEERYVLPARTPRPEVIRTVPPESDGHIMQEETAPSYGDGSATPAANTPQRADDPASSPETTAPKENETPVPTEIPPTPLPEYAPISVDFESLREMNQECIGWIYIPDTNISYPVMQTDNNSKYLDTLPDGTKNKAGSVFMDFRNKTDFSDGNTILYGHNLQNGSMFASLRKYEKQAFFEAHRSVYYLTPDGDYKITVIACAKVSPSGESYELYDDKEALHSYLGSVLRRAFVSASVDPDRVNCIVTLSTCTGKYGSRIIVIGIPERLL